MANNSGKQEHAFKTFSSDLKSDNFPAVILMYGEEDYLIDWAAGSLIKRYVNPAAMSLDYVKLGDEQDVDSVIEACNTFSLFSEKRIVWVKDYPLLKTAKPKGFTDSDKEKLLEYVKNPNEGTLLILTSDTINEKDEKKDKNEKSEKTDKNDKNEKNEKNVFVKELKKYCRSYNFNKLEYSQFAAFAEKRFRAAHVNISRSTLRYLIDETGYFNKDTVYRISTLENDIKKIIAYGDGRTVKEEDISATLNGDMDTFVFNFLDALSNNKKDTAFNLLQNILASGSDAFSIVALLVNHFELILEVKEFKQDGMGWAEIKDILKIHEFRIKKAMAFADKFTVEKLKSILIRLYEIDRSIKTGILEPNLSLELLVGRI